MYGGLYVHLAEAALRFFRDDYFRRGVEFAQGGGHFAGIPFIILHYAFHFKPFYLAGLALRLVNLDYLDALRHGRRQALGEIVQRGLAPELEVHDLAHAAGPDGQRQGNGYLRAWVEALGVFQPILRP